MTFRGPLLGLVALALAALPATAQVDPTRDDPSSPAVRTPLVAPVGPTADDPSATPTRAPTAVPDGPAADDPAASPMSPTPTPPAARPSARDRLPERARSGAPFQGPRRSPREALPARSASVTPAAGPRRPAREVLAEHGARFAAFREALGTQRAARARSTPETPVEAPSAALASVAVPEAVEIDGPWPNPVRDRARLTLTPSRDGLARVAVYDVRGREVLVAFDGAVVAGVPVSVSLDVGRLAAGTYLVVLDADGARASRPVQVVR